MPGASPNDVYLKPGSGSGPVVLHNVAAGSVNAGSTDAVNGGQVNSLGTSLASALGGGATFNTTTGSINAPRYTVGGEAYDNVGGAVAALDQRTGSIESNLGVLQSRIDHNRKIASAGTAAAVASGQIRYGDKPGGQTLGLGVGYYDGQAAIAAGYAFTSVDSAWRGNASVGYSPGVAKVTVGAGLSYSW